MYVGWILNFLRLIKQRRKIERKKGFWHFSKKNTLGNRDVEKLSGKVFKYFDIPVHVIHLNFPSGYPLDADWKVERMWIRLWIHSNDCDLWDIDETDLVWFIIGYPYSQSAKVSCKTWKLRGWRAKTPTASNFSFFFFLELLQKKNENVFWNITPGKVNKCDFF